MTFQGFSPQTLMFLKQLKKENSKTWFQTHKEDYDRLVFRPFQDLVKQLSETMLKIDPYFEVRPMVDKTISRIYRDTRFSRDKSLFKDHVWITFKRPSPDWKDAPCYFFEITPEYYHYGMGYYSASKATMDQLRESIDDNPQQFVQVISFFKKQDVFRLEGDLYKRPIANQHPPEIQEWYHRKNFYLYCRREVDHLLFSRALGDRLAEDFLLLKPIYQYLSILKSHFYPVDK